ncbi:MAG TPA: xanthine dehydrogenase family protein subunit M [Thermomicrobiales bacterium]|nr:xanthine dehydrogenase family protein subunit M [Thermomicrobiales bacterium]
MIPGEFEYYRATSVQEAVQLLQQHADAKLLAGGHSLIPMMKLRLATPPALIDLGGIQDLSGVQQADGGLTIGALTTHGAIEEDAALKESWPIFYDAAHVIGDPMVRHRGTFGGSLAHADPAGDWPAVALALGAQMKAIGPNGNRTIAADDFFVDLLTSALEPGEVLTEITIPAKQGKTGMSYQKFSHPASGYAVVGVAAVVNLDDSGTCTDCRVAITGAGPKATRATATEDALKGKKLDEQTIAGAADKAGEGMDFLGDIYASEEYRQHLVKVFTKRALEAAAQNAK